MEFYVVVDKATGQQVGKGFSKRMDAKAKRNDLQAKTKRGMPEPEESWDQAQWSFKVSFGKDHPKYPRPH